jgi:hypothetical protein
LGGIQRITEDYIDACEEVRANDYSPLQKLTRRQNAADCCMGDKG